MLALYDRCENACFIHFEGLDGHFAALGTLLFITTVSHALKRLVKLAREIKPCCLLISSRAAAEVGAGSVAVAVRAGAGLGVDRDVDVRVVVLVDARAEVADRTRAVGLGIRCAIGHTLRPAKIGRSVSQAR